jgi:hypothetical protein
MPQLHYLRRRLLVEPIDGDTELSSLAMAQAFLTPS